MSHRALSHAEFAAQGGGSRRFSDGTEAAGGYYVSRHPSEGGEVRHDRHATAVDVATHFTANRQRALGSARMPHEVYQGLWEDHREGGVTSYLDVSDRVGTRSAAIQLGLKNKQRAVYDANEGKSLFLRREGTSTRLTSPSDSRIHHSDAYYSAQRNSTKRRVEWN